MYYRLQNRIPGEIRWEYAYKYRNALFCANVPRSPSFVKEETMVSACTYAGIGNKCTWDSPINQPHNGLCVNITRALVVRSKLPSRGPEKFYSETFPFARLTSERRNIDVTSSLLSCTLHHICRTLQPHLIFARTVRQVHVKKQRLNYPSLLKST